ncbi:MAG: type II secretion system F family protein [Planctomycetes bacterium]|nr:type II secretion system F family protein [Planctomycetota bacterium]
METEGIIVMTIIYSGVILVATFVCAWIGARPMGELIRAQEQMYDVVLRSTLLLDVKPRSFTILTALVIVCLGLLGYVITSSIFGALLLAAIGAAFPAVALRLLRRRRLNKLEDQIVGAIQTLASGVRAGLNLVQSMELIAKDGPDPIRQEFAHLLREYEYGVPLNEAMIKAGARIGSGDFRLLFAALHTHRERGGDLGETLDRIADSIREIQRLERRIETLTAQGRATSRWLGAMPGVVMLILYFLVDPEGVRSLFIDNVGKLLLLGIVILNIVGFMWIRKIMSLDI